ncbi:putative ankyrin repeat protein [Paramyrothecium foliicola]|nr:putative ankyrin repeat protein [Paramyrothecium foliicola]
MIANANASFLPDDVIFRVCHACDFKTLAALTRVHKPLQQIAEETLYRKDVELHGIPTAALYAARHNRLATLKKALSYLGPASIHSLVEARGRWDVSSVAQLTVQDDDENLLGESEGEYAEYTEPVSDHHPRDNFDGGYLRFEAGTALHEAAARGHGDMVRSLLEVAADTEAKADFKGTFYEYGSDIEGTHLQVTPLFLALFHKKEEVASLLLKHGASQAVSFDIVSGLPAYGALPLAIYACSEKIVDDLLMHYNADINWGLDTGSWLPIHVVVTQAATVDLLPKLLHAGARIDTPVANRFPPTGSTIIHLVAFLNDEAAASQAIDSLVLAGADINVQLGGMTLLHVATATRNPSLLRILLSRGFEVKHEPDSREGILDLLVEGWHDDNGPGFGETTKQTYRDRVERAISCIQILVGAGAKLHPYNVHSFMDTDPAIADVLQERVSKVPRVPPELWLENFIEEATEDYCGSLNTFAFLLKHNAGRTNRTSRHYWKFIIFCLYHGPKLTRDYVIQFLHKNVHLGRISSEKGCDCLMRLLRNRLYSYSLHGGLVEGLMAADGFNIHATDCFGNTYLHHLVDNRSIKQNDLVATLRALTGSGLDIDAKNRLGQSALHHVASRWAGHLEKYGSAGLQREFSKLDALSTALIFPLATGSKEWLKHNLRELGGKDRLGLKSGDYGDRCMSFQTPTSRRGRARPPNVNQRLANLDVIFGVEPVYFVPDCEDEKFHKESNFVPRERPLRNDRQQVMLLTKAALSRLSVQENPNVTIA